MSLKLTDTGYGRRMLFTRILSAKLYSCGYRINAFFEWKKKTQIFSLRFTGCGNIRLGINLNDDAGELYPGCAENREQALRYRAYFIAAYVRCLEKARDTVPDSFFGGLAVLEAMADIHGGKTVDVYSPLRDPVRSPLRPIDVYCAIHALSLIRTEGAALSGPEQGGIDRAMDRLLDYSLMPEIEYGKDGTPEYAAPADLLRLRQLTASGRCRPGEYAVFRQYGIPDPDGLAFSRLPAEGNAGEPWAGVLIRLHALAEETAGGIDAAAFPHAAAEIKEFKKNSAALYRRCASSERGLTADNLLAVRKLSGMIERAFPGCGCAETGTMHYVR